MRVVGSQYDATVGVEAWVAKAEAKVKVGYYLVVSWYVVMGAGWEKVGGVGRGLGQE